METQFFTDAVFGNSYKNCDFTSHYIFPKTAGGQPTTGK